MFGLRHVTISQGGRPPLVHVCACLLTAALAHHAQAGPFEVAVALDPKEVSPGDLTTAKVTFTIAPRHYLYAGRTNALKPVSAEGISFGKILKPSGQRKLDPYLGAVSIYKETVTLELPVLVADTVGPGKKQITLQVEYQGCTDTACFPPKKKELRAEFSVKGADDPTPAVPPTKPAPSVDDTAASSPFQVSASAIPEAVAPGQSLKISVAFTIADKHYLQADKTTIKVEPAAGLAYGSIVKPKAIEKTDPYLGKLPIYRTQATFELPITVAESAELGQRTIALTATYMGCSETACFPPEDKRLDVRVSVVSSADANAATQQAPREPAPAATEQEPSESKAKFVQRIAEKFGVLGVIVASFGFGILISFTPCIYPMIPVTVAVIGANDTDSKSRGFMLSVVYVLGLSLTYAVLGAAAAVSGTVFGSYGQHPAVRIVVAAIFSLLAMSMFDVFYLQVPTAISSRLGGKKGAGVLGVLLTGAASGAVAGPCVAPFLAGLLVYIAGLGNVVLGFLVMWSFALGMGTLLIVVGTASSAATSMPRAGLWMEKVKQFMGIVLLAFALYTVSPPVIPEAAFFLLVDALLVGCGVFAAGLLGAPDMGASKAKRFGRVAILVALALCISYAIRLAFGQQTGAQAGIDWVKDEPSALAEAKLEGRPMMLDFRADWCSACRKLENETFVDPSAIEESLRFTCVKIDCTDSDDEAAKEVQNKYGVVGLPTIAFVDSQGQFQKERSITGFVKPDALLKAMRATE